MLNLKNLWNRSVPAALCSVLLLALNGCSRNDVDLAGVRGTVLMDGKPLKDAMVVFIPQNAGRTAMGGTNERGEYEMRYSAVSSGALVGPMRVEIRTGHPDNLRQFPETVPARYNAKSELTAEVLAQENVIDFDLKSTK